MYGIEYIGRGFLLRHVVMTKSFVENYKGKNPIMLEVGVIAVTKGIS